MTNSGSNPKSDLETGRLSLSLNRLQRIQHGLREEMAEFLGTATLILIGLGGGAQFSLLHTADMYMGVWTLWGLGVMCGIYLAGSISGAHLNGAVTLASALYGRFPWRKVPRYIAAQILGAFTAASILFAFYYTEFTMKDPMRTTHGNTTTAGTFYVTSPIHRGNMQELISEFIATSTLVLVIFACTAEKNEMKPSKSMTAVVIGLVVIGIGAALGSSGGYALNPSRDIGPRIFAAVAGYGTGVFTEHDFYFWVPVVGSFLGGIFGGGLHKFFLVY